jgi:hypothetical protein
MSAWLLLPGTILELMQLLVPGTHHSVAAHLTRVTGLSVELGVIASSGVSTY